MQWLDTLQSSTSQLGPWSYFLLALLVAVEGPIATLLGAVAASANAMRLPWVFAAAATGNLLADSCWYAMGYFGHVKSLYRLGRWVGVKSEQVARLEAQMHRHAVKILLVAKLTAGLVIPSLLAAGLLRIPWRKWFLPILLAEMIWTGTLVLLGYYATQWIREIEYGIQIFVISGTILAVLFIVYRIRHHKHK